MNGRAVLSQIFENSLSKAERLPSTLNWTIAPVDNSLGAAERMPSAVNRTIYQMIAPLDHRYDTVEKVRGNLR